MEKKPERIVIALGGNALQGRNSPGTAEAQLEVVRQICRRIAKISNMGYEIAIVHGNGPQVGRIVLPVKQQRTLHPLCRSMFVEPCPADISDIRFSSVWDTS